MKCRQIIVYKYIDLPVFIFLFISRPQEIVGLYKRL